MNKLPFIERASYSSHYKRNGESNKRGSFFFISVILTVLFGVVIFRLFQLTVVKGDYYRRLSDENRVREVVIEPKRGTILDRNGVVIAHSSDPDFKDRSDFIKTKRIYSAADAIGHIVGYRAVADKTDIEQDDCLNPLGLGDKTGKKGVEKAYDCELRGTRGKKMIELDAHGKEVKVLGLVPPKTGKDIHLALDMNLQRRAYDLLVASASARAAVIATRPTTGEVLAMASAPSYDPQAFEDNDQKKMETYLTSPTHPLFNRATEGTYPPGSIFKLIVAAGALEDKKITESTTILDTGFVKVGPAIYNNWYYTDYGKTEGEVNVIKALQRSNDTFFYKVGEKMGENRIKFWSEKMGLGQRVPFPLDQVEGLVPSPFWKQERLGEDWFTGDTFNFSIGQGYVLTTPLQMHQAAAAFADKGTICEPQLLKNAYPLCRSMKFSKETIDLVRRGMQAACATGGTAYPFFDFQVNGKKIITGCKTGTAESQNPKETKPHAWFTIFAPYENPEIHITVLVENAGQGSQIASPIAAELLKTYFSQK